MIDDKSFDCTVHITAVWNITEKYDTTIQIDIILSHSLFFDAKISHTVLTKYVN